MKPIKPSMVGELGVIYLQMTEECESAISLHLDVNRADYTQSHQITALSAAMFDLGAIISNPELDGKGNTNYTVFFTRVFERKLYLYEELLNFLHTNGVEIEAYWEANGRTYWINNADTGRGQKLSLLREGSPSNIAEVREQVAEIKYWSEITDLYVHIPPPTRSVLKNR